MTDKERYIKRCNGGYRVTLHYLDGGTKRCASLHFVTQGRAEYMGKILKESGRYERVTVGAVNDFCVWEV